MQQPQALNIYEYYGKRPEILTHVQQPQVSIQIYLKGRFCYQRGTESIRQPIWKGCLSHKNTLFTHKVGGVGVGGGGGVGGTEANDNSNEWVSYIPLTDRSWGDGDRRSLGLNSWPLGYQVSSFTTTPPRHPFLIRHTVEYLINGLQTLHHALPLHLHQACAITLLIS